MQESCRGVRQKNYDAAHVAARCIPKTSLLPLLLLPQIDMITYENVTSTSAVWPALMGVNAQLSFISHAAARERPDWRLRQCTLACHLHTAALASIKETLGGELHRDHWKNLPGLVNLCKDDTQFHCLSICCLLWCTYTCVKATTCRTLT